MKSINITEETKQIFDTLQIELSSLKGKILSQDETLCVIMEMANESKTREVKA